MLDKLRLWVAVVVVVVWVVSVGLDVVVPAYDPPATVHLLMMLVAGWLFAPALTGRMRRDGDDE